MRMCEIMLGWTGCRCQPQVHVQQLPPVTLQFPSKNVNISLRYSSLLPYGLQYSLGDPDAFKTGGHSAVDGYLHQRFSYLCLGDPIVDGTVNVHRKLRHAIESAEHGYVQQTSDWPTQSWPLPYHTPSYLGGKILHWPSKLRRVILEGSLNVFGSSNFLANFEALIVEQLVSLGHFIFMWLLL